LQCEFGQRWTRLVHLPESQRAELYTDRVFAGLAAVIVIGLLVEHLVFDTLERVTVRRWGVQQ
jgi:ABC-type nitrate/sulfonate/bicarbonate transport system permease component